MGVAPATSTTTAGSTSTSPTSAPTGCCATGATAPSRTSPRPRRPTTGAGRCRRRSSTSTATAGSTSTSATTSVLPRRPRALPDAERSARLLRPGAYRRSPTACSGIAATASFDDVSARRHPTDTGSDPGRGGGRLRRRRLDRPLRRQRPMANTCGSTSATVASETRRCWRAWRSTARASPKPAWGSTPATSTATATRPRPDPSAAGDQHRLRQRRQRPLRGRLGQLGPRAAEPGLHRFGTAWLDYDNDGRLDC